MAVRETKIAVIKHLCEHEAANDYVVGSYVASRVAKELGMSYNLVLRAMELAENESWVIVHARPRAVTPEGVPFMDMEFSLRAKALEDFEKHVGGGG